MVTPTRKQRPSSKRNVSGQVYRASAHITSETETFHGETGEPTARTEKNLSLTISASCNSLTFVVLWRPACISVSGSLCLLR